MYGVKMITFTDVTIEGDASNMFEGCGATTINASGLNVTGVTSMSKMFSDCSALASIDGLSNTYDDVKGRVDNEYAIQKHFGDTGVTASYRLHLDSATGISVLVRPGSGALAEPSGTLQPSPGSGDVAKQADVTQQSDGSLDGIPAHRLADKLMVTGAAGSEQFSVEVCPLSYVWTVFNKPSGTVLERDAMAAFLEYYDASIAYKNGKATA